MPALIDYGKCIEGVYNLCLNPSETVLPFQRVIQEIELADTVLCADLDNTDQLWRLKRWPITVDGSTDEFRIFADDFARMVMVEIEPPAGSRTRRRVFIVDIDEQKRYVVSQQAFFTGAYLGPGWPVEEIGFFRLDGDVWCRVSPPPLQSYNLILTYEPGPPVDKQDTEQPGSVQAAPNVAYPLLVAVAAHGCMPGCTHVDADTKRAQMKSIDEKIAMYKPIWDLYKFQDNQEEKATYLTGFSLGSRCGGRYLG